MRPDWFLFERSGLGLLRSADAVGQVVNQQSDYGEGKHEIEHDIEVVQEHLVFEPI